MSIMNRFPSGGDVGSKAVFGTINGVSTAKSLVISEIDFTPANISIACSGTGTFIGSGKVMCASRVSSGTMAYYYITTSDTTATANATVTYSSTDKTVTISSGNHYFSFAQYRYAISE